MTDNDRCPHDLTELITPSADEAYRRMKHFSLEVLSQFPAAHLTMSLFDVVQVRYRHLHHDFHRAVNELQRAYESVAELQNMLSALPGGDSMLHSWKCQKAAEALHEMRAPVARCIPMEST